MSNLLYRGAAERMLGWLTGWVAAQPFDNSGGSLPAGGDRVTVQMLGGYEPDATQHRFLSDIPAENRLGPAIALTGVRIADGVFDADDVTIPGVTVTAVTSLILYVATADPATSPLLLHIDTAAGLPLSTAGGDVLITWNNSPLRIFSL